ncbi:MAG: hypothetical protein RIQ72_192 [Candidatus Parcubacteria bacterium]|jgi:hypothetical protein
MQTQNQDKIQNIQMSDKLERIATAIYMVTNHLSDREPLKSKLRTLAYELVEMSYKSESIESGLLEQNLSVTSSLILVASKARLVANQNAEIIVLEINRVKDMLLSSDTKGVIEQSLRNLFTDISIDDYVASDTQVQSISMHQVPSKGSEVKSISPLSAVNQKGDQTMSPSMPTLQNQPDARVGYFGTSQPSVSKVIRKNESNQNTGKVQSGSASSNQAPGVLTDRQSTIVKEIRLKGQLTIRDLVDKITGCSEKTIQRELLALVEHGVLKKEGERRWSRYSIGV